MAISEIQANAENPSESVKVAVCEQLHTAKLELELKTQETLQQMQHLWLSEKAEVRKGVPRSLLNQSANSNGQAHFAELIALREQMRNEFQIRSAELQRMLGEQKMRSWQSLKTRKGTETVRRCRRP